MLSTWSEGTWFHDMESTEAEECRQEHWKLLGALKTTVEGLLSTNNPNVWSKYGGLERLCKEMNNIMCHGLLEDKIYLQHKDYWPFVKDVCWVSPHLAHHIEQLMDTDEQSIPKSNPQKAQYWLHHSLQFHCLSSQLRPLLSNYKYTRKFYKDTAFLLSDPHVTAMFQCLEAVEQNNPKILAQIDTSVFARKFGTFLPMVKSQSLTALPGIKCTSLSEGGQQRHTASYTALSGHSTSNISGATPQGFINNTQQETRKKAHLTCFPDSTDKLIPDKGSGIHQFNIIPSVEPFSPVSETTVSTPVSHGEDSWGEVQDEGSSEIDDGPEYLAIGNLGQRDQSSSQCSDTSSSYSGGSQKIALAAGQVPKINVNCSASLLNIPRSSSFSEIKALEQRGGFKKSHIRSHSDTGISSTNAPGDLRKITIIVEDPVEESHPEIRHQEYGPFSAQNSEVSTPSSPYMEAEGSQHTNNSDGMFRRPSQGQSLISYLSEQDFGSCADLEKENAHFSISESLIAAIELMKCNLMKKQMMEDDEDDSDKEIRELKQKIRIRRQQIQTRKLLPAVRNSESDTFTTTESGSPFSSHDSVPLSDSGSTTDGVDEFELKDCIDESNLIHMSANGLSASMASLFSDADIRRSLASSTKSVVNSESISFSFLHSNSAEAVAMGLLKQFEGMQLPAASELDWLVPEHDAPQKLLPIPDSFPVSPDDGEHADIYQLRIRVRGNLEWAPPRPQIIFNIHPSPKRKVVVAKQNYRCAGCGIRVDPEYIKRLRYCEYLGKYFCQCCHENVQSAVPSRILRKWDFSKYYVSNFSKDLLNKIWNDPLFNVQDINSALYRKVKALDQVHMLRMQLVHMKNLLKTCRLAKDLLDTFDREPGHLTEDLHLYSLNDLTAIKKGELAGRLKDLVKLGSAHVAQCMLCQAKGFICEFCGNDTDIIFPFELHKCKRCEECKACYHKCCFKSDHCPRCDRFQARKEMLAKQTIKWYSSEVQGGENENSQGIDCD
ncbi:run domain Beclin-1-interacting and cysteine-rich domain-containing protein isoform X2 [Pristis pectinata]|uniref:run domain Beclin-1-interacting and cysteine-rich domain-containing protein isoform X2 n=1 Tax=Pristis pectinata TaxID=685728 RepID=UPI00223CB737|nr:run domain Beclin-1-interacting and cysteine-rich domain-containing protein isoform X2 [Pristis pectinata]